MGNSVHRIGFGDLHRVYSNCMAGRRGKVHVSSSIVCSKQRGCTVSHGLNTKRYEHMKVMMAPTFAPSLYNLAGRAEDIPLMSYPKLNVRPIRSFDNPVLPSLADQRSFLRPSSQPQTSN